MAAAGGGVDMSSDQYIQLSAEEIETLLAILQDKGEELRLESYHLFVRDAKYGGARQQAVDTVRQQICDCIAKLERVLR